MAVRLRKNDRPFSVSRLKVFVLLLLAVSLMLPLVCGPKHLQHEARGALSSLCASVMAPAVAVSGSLFALVLIQTLMPGVYSFSIPLVLELIPKPPQ